MCNQKIANVLKNVYTEVRDRSLFIAWGGRGRAENFFLGGGDHLIFRRTKVASVVTENPKGGSLKTLDGLRGGTTKFVWKMKTWGVDRESHQMLLGGITSVN